jgi:sterol desaturase/sphingolipid hydroxylase (fatty acid hydroxylase superfamily)
LLGAAALAGVAALMYLERRRALRRPAAAGGAQREVTNLALAGSSALASHLAMTPVVRPLARRTVRDRTGLVQQLRAPEWVRDALAVILLDYTLYWWHVVEHRVPWLYRFHQVHHADLEMDTSTAVRFHAGEFVASIPWRVAQIRIIGVSPRALAIWQRLTALSVVFHHSNLRLPAALERRIARVLMTPRLHGIHHSIVAAEQSSNWSSGLTIWDRLHGSYRALEGSRVPTIGVPYARHADDVTLARSLAMPFEPLPAWRLPNGTVPSSTGLPAKRSGWLAR